MLDRLLFICMSLETVLKDLKHDSLTNNEWKRVTDLLAPFREQTYYREEECVDQELRSEDISYD